MKIVTAVDVKKRKQNLQSEPVCGKDTLKSYIKRTPERAVMYASRCRLAALKLAVRQQARQSLLSMKRDDTEARLARGGGGFSVAICHVPTRVLVAT